MQGPPPTLRPDTCDVPSHLSTNLRSRGSLLWGNFDMLFCRDLGILSPIPGHKFQGAMWGKRKKDTIFSPCLHPQRDDVQKYHLLLQRQRQYKHLISNNLLGGSLFKLYSVWISWKSGVPHLLWKGSSEVHISPVFPEHDRSSSACASGVSCPGCQEGQAEEAVSETSLKEVISGLCFIGSIIYSVYLCSLPLLLLSELSQQHRYGLVNCSTWGFWAFAPERRACRPPEKLYSPGYRPVRGTISHMADVTEDIQKASATPPWLFASWVLGHTVLQHCPQCWGKLEMLASFPTYTVLLGKLPLVSVTGCFSPLWLQQPHPGVSRLHWVEGNFKWVRRRGCPGEMCLEALCECQLSCWQHPAQQWKEASLALPASTYLPHVFC